MSISAKGGQHELSRDAQLNNLQRVANSLCSALSLAYPGLQIKERMADSSAAQMELPADLIALEKISSELLDTQHGRDNQIFIEVPGILISEYSRPRIPISEALNSFIDLARAIANDDLPAGQSPGLTLRALTELAGSIERHADKIADLRISQESAAENLDESQNTDVEPGNPLSDPILDPEDESVLIVPKPHNEPTSEPDQSQNLTSTPGPVIRAMREIVEFVRNKTTEVASIAARALGSACKGIIKVLAKHLEIVHIPIQIAINPNLKGLIIGCAFAIGTGVIKRLINGKIPPDALSRSWSGGQEDSSYSLTFDTRSGEAGKTYSVGDVSGPGMEKFQESLATTVVRFLEPRGSKLSSLFDNLAFWGPRVVDLWYPQCVNLDKELDRIKAHSVKICLPLNVSKNNEKPIYLPLPMGWQVHFLSLEGNRNNSSDLSIRAGVLGGLVLEGVLGATRVRYQISPKEKPDPVTPEMLFYLQFFTPEALFSQDQRDGTNPSSAIQSASQQEIVDACAGLMWLEGYRYSRDPWIGSLCQAAQDDSLQVAQILKYGKCDALAAALASTINQNGVVSLVAGGLVLATDSEGKAEAAFYGNEGHAVTLAVGLSEAQEGFIKEIDLTKMVSNKQLPSALIDDWRRGELLLKMRRASTTEARLSVAREALTDLRLYGEHGCGVEPPGLSRMRVNKAIGAFILPTHPGYRRDRRFVPFTDTPGPLPQELALSLVGEELALRIESIVSDASKVNWTETDWQRHLASLSFISQALEASESFAESVRNQVFNAASALLSRCEQEIELVPAEDFHIRITYLNLFVKVGHKTWSNDPSTENIGFYTKPDPRSLAKLLTSENIEQLTIEQVNSLAKLLPKLPLEVLGPQILEIYQVVRTLYGAVNLSNSTDPTLEDIGSRLIMTALRDCNTRQFENIQTELLQEGFEWLLKSTKWTDRIQDSSGVNEILDAFIYSHKISLLEDIEWCFISCLADTIGTRDYFNRLESSPRDNPAMSASTRAAVERIKDRTALRAQSWIDRLVSRVDLAMAKGQDINARRIAALLNELPDELAGRFMHRLHDVAYNALLKNNQIFTSLVLELDNVNPLSWSEPLTALYLQGLYEVHPTVILLRNLAKFVRVSLLDQETVQLMLNGIAHHTLDSSSGEADRFLSLFELKFYEEDFCSIVPDENRGAAHQVPLQHVISGLIRDIPIDDSKTIPADRVFRILASAPAHNVFSQGVVSQGVNSLAAATTRLINYLSSHPDVARVFWDKWGWKVGSVQMFRRSMLGRGAAEIKRNRYLALISGMFWRDDPQMECGITIDGICSNEVDRLTSQLVSKVGDRSELRSIAIPWDSAVATDLSPLKTTPLSALIYNEASNQIFQVEGDAKYDSIGRSLQEELNLQYSFDFESEAARLFGIVDRSKITTERDLWRAVYNNFVPADSQPLHLAKNITQAATKAFGANLHGRFDYYRYLRSTFKIVVPSRGQGEFKSIREYHRGDDPRTISWRAAGRSDKLLVRDLEVDNNPPVVLLVDAQSVVGPRSDEAIRHQLYEQIARAGVGQAPLQVTLVWRGVTENIIIPATVRSKIAVARGDEYPRALQGLEQALLKIGEILSVEQQLCGDTLDYSADIALGASPLNVKGAVIIPIMSTATRDAQAKVFNGLIAMGNQVCHL